MGIAGYFVDWVGAEGWAQFRDSAGSVRKLFPVPHPIGFDGSVAISPDEAWIAYSQLDRSGNAILLTKGWR